MSIPPTTLPQILEEISQHHQALAGLYVKFQGVLLMPDQTPSLGDHLAAAGVAVETPASAPAPSPAPVSAKKVPAPAPAASPRAGSAVLIPGPGSAAATPAPAPAAPADAAGLTVGNVIAAMQAHAARFKASGGAVATLKKVKSVGGWTSASSVPAEKRAELIEALAADNPVAGA